jgi:PBP1b-binding outer membrane lipoprotein LpoB
MKFYAVIIIVIIFFSSCLKESIPDAMLGSKNSEGTTATMSYEVNGNAVNITVDNADNQDTDYYI